MTRSVVARAAGTDLAGLAAGRRAGQSLTEIAASHHVSRATLLARLDAAADTRVVKLVNAKLPVGSAGAHRPVYGWARHHGIGMAYKDVASTLKLTPKTLTARLRSGQTLQQIATAQHVSTAALIAVIDKDVDAAVAKAADRAPKSRTRVEAIQ